MKLRSFWPYGMKIRIHPLFLLILMASIAVGMFVQTLVLFTIVVVHELGHIFVAVSYGYKVREMQILPFGGVAKLEHGAMGWNPRHEVAIAIAGPLNNFLMILVGMLLHATGLWSDALTQFFIKGNLMIGFFNLLPALPLDGGRILRAATSRERGFRAATEVSIRMSYLLATVLIVSGLVSLWVGSTNLAFLMLGSFLALSAWELRKQMKVDVIRFLDAKRRDKRKEAQLVRSLAVPGTTKVRDVIEKFAPDAYHMIYILDAGKNVQTVLGEEDLVHSVFEDNGLRLTLTQVAERIQGSQAK
jgi:stage IV sporulation protein FB